MDPSRSVSLWRAAMPLGRVARRKRAHQNRGTTQLDRIGLDDMLLETVFGLFAQWWWLIALVVALAILREVAFGKPFRRYRSKRYPRRTGRWQQAQSGKSDPSLRLGDPKAQMEFVSRVDFEPRRLLNKPEYGILQILERVTKEINGGYRVMAQTSLGEIIAPASASGSEEARDLAFRSINSKRLDFLVIDRTGMPALAVEYQGHGHYQNKAFMRDAVKREAVRKARIQFLEIPAEYDVKVVEDQIRSVLRPSPARPDRRRGTA